MLEVLEGNCLPLEHLEHIEHLEHLASKNSPRKEISANERLHVGIALVGQIFDPVTATTERQVNETRTAERDPDVGDATVGAVGEEKEIRGG